MEIKTIVAKREELELIAEKREIFNSKKGKILRESPKDSKRIGTEGSCDPDYIAASVEACINEYLANRNSDCRYEEYSEEIHYNDDSNVLSYFDHFTMMIDRNDGLGPILEDAQIVTVFVDEIEFDKVQANSELGQALLNQKAGDTFHIKAEGRRPEMTGQIVAIYKKEKEKNNVR